MDSQRLWPLKPASMLSSTNTPATVCDIMCRQLLSQQLPQRKSQLYNTYGPGGPIPLIPAAQQPQAPLVFGRVDASSGSGSYVELVNNNQFAVDVSNWQ